MPNQKTRQVLWPYVVTAFAGAAFIGVNVVALSERPDRGPAFAIVCGSVVVLCALLGLAFAGPRARVVAAVVAAVLLGCVGAALQVFGTNLPTKLVGVLLALMAFVFIGLVVWRDRSSQARAKTDTELSSDTSGLSS